MDYYYDKLLGQNICKLRGQKGWTQEPPAAKLQTAGCGITRSALAKIEAGQRHLYSCEIKVLKIVPEISFNRIACIKSLMRPPSGP
ncbi:MAG: helix-turn-helix domain-containing protein [Clostridiales bacterium]|nr:helix-turn-helix domain-containing protein [Clostridiales bacterium]